MRLTNLNIYPSMLYTCSQHIMQSKSATPARASCAVAPTAATSCVHALTTTSQCSRIKLVVLLVLVCLTSSSLFFFVWAPIFLLEHATCSACNSCELTILRNACTLRFGGLKGMIRAHYPQCTCSIFNACIPWAVCKRTPTHASTACDDAAS